MRPPQTPGGAAGGVRPPQTPATFGSLGIRPPQTPGGPLVAPPQTPGGLFVAVHAPQTPAGLVSSMLAPQTPGGLLAPATSAAASAASKSASAAGSRLPTCADLGIGVSAFPLTQTPRRAASVAAPFTPAAPGVSEMVPQTPARLISGLEAFREVSSYPGGGGGAATPAVLRAGVPQTPAVLRGAAAAPATPAVLRGSGPVPCTPAAIRGVAVPMTPAAIRGMPVPVPCTPSAIRGAPATVRAGEDIAPLTPGAMLLRSAVTAKEEDSAPLTPGAMLLRSALAAKKESEPLPASMATATRDADSAAAAFSGAAGVDAKVAAPGSAVAAGGGGSPRKRAAEPVSRFQPKRRKSVADKVDSTVKTEAAPLSPPAGGTGGGVEVKQEVSLGMSFGEWQRARESQAVKSVFA